MYLDNGMWLDTSSLKPEVIYGVCPTVMRFIPFEKTSENEKDDD